MKSFAQGILNFFDNLKSPDGLPADVELLWPYDKPEVQRVMRLYYEKYYNDSRERIFLIGINPGRFGAGVTGVCFSDPFRLDADCGIPHSLSGGRELSSDFVYRMIERYGSPRDYFGNFYLTALSPVGYVRSGRNLNYYDVKGLPEILDDWMAKAMKAQIDAGGFRKVAFSIGMGKNFKHLEAFNKRHGFFERVEPLPHPRWVMQYRRKRLDEFVDLYISRLNEARS